MFERLKSILMPVYELGIKIGASFDDSTTFTEVSEQISTLYEMYMGKEKGKQLIRAITKFRSSTIMGGGLNVVYTGQDSNDITENPNEIKFLENMIDLNNVNQGLNRKLITASEIEGQVLVKIQWKEGDNTEENPSYAKIIYLPFQTTGYEFTTAENDPEEIVSVKYKLGESEVDEAFDNYSFVAFNALPGALQGYSNMGTIIEEMKDVDEALRDWRKMNRNFASSTPVFKCETLKEAEQHKAELEKQQWTKGKALFTTADFNIIQGVAGDYQSIEREIVDKIKIISAETGVPVQHLGLPDELSNRATAESMDEPVQRISDTEEDLWATFWERVFDVAVRLNNESPSGTFGTLRTNVVEPDTTGVSSGDYAAVENVYLPMYKEGALALETLWEFTPKLNTMKERERNKNDNLTPQSTEN